ncbi:MAG: DUF6090 family protein [Gelidibacter sp.]
MIHFFRKIRKNLLAENKTTRYLKYAIGEVILIMLGIFMALQLQNWNEKRKQEAEFKVTLEQLYNSIDKDISKSENTIHYLSKQGQLIQAIMSDTDSIPRDKLIPVLFYLDSQPPEYMRSESAYQFSLLKPNPHNSIHNEISKQISSYVDSNSTFLIKNNSNPIISEYLTKHGISKVYLQFGYAQINNFTDYDGDYYTDDDINKVLELLKTEDLKNILKETLSYKQHSYFQYNLGIQDGVSMQNMIKAYYPTVKLLYKDLGIIGNAIGGWAHSVPMTLVDPNNCVWQIETTLKDGFIKFRSRDSWTENWGKTGFTNKALYSGDNIPVTAGTYKITLNLSEKTYEFTKQNE